MDARELPLILFREFSMATFEETEQCLVGETERGQGLLVVKEKLFFGETHFTVHRSATHISDNCPLLKIIAGSRCTNETCGSKELIKKVMQIKFPIFPDRRLDLTPPAAVTIAGIIARAVELTQAGGFELGSFWYDWSKEKRVKDPRNSREGR